MNETHRDFVTIVSGLPRSGTSLMMQMIAAGGIPALTDDFRKPDEDNPRGYYEFEAVKKTREDASWLADAAGKVVKMVHLLLLDLPTDRPYRVVFMRRDLREVLASQNVMLQRLGKGTGELPEERITEVFRSQMGQVEKWMHEHDCFQYRPINYNELIQRPQPAVLEVNELLGGDLDTEAMLSAIDPTLYRQRSG